MKGIGIAEVLDLICTLVFFSAEEDALHLLGFEQLQVTSELIGFDYSAVGQRCSSRQAEGALPLPIDSLELYHSVLWFDEISEVFILVQNAEFGLSKRKGSFLLADFDIVLIVLCSYAVFEVFWEDADEKKAIQMRTVAIDLIAADSRPRERD